MDDSQPRRMNPLPGARRHVRSRRGCLTCKRRKVKCNEQGPRCSHCERLNMQCVWSSPRMLLPQHTRESPGQTLLSGDLFPADIFSDGSFDLPMSALNDIFGLAGVARGSCTPQQQQDGSPVAVRTPPTSTSWSVPTNSNAAVQDAIYRDHAQQSYEPEEAGSSIFSDTLNDDELMDFFKGCARPPILVAIEARNKWSSIRRAIVEMAERSAMVRSAVTTFACVLITRGKFDDPSAEARYNSAEASLAVFDGQDLSKDSRKREDVLVSTFFLSYVDVLTRRADSANLNLMRAHRILRMSDKASFSPMERQILLWLRIVDARAVSAGGDGLLLADNDHTLWSGLSPITMSCGDKKQTEDQDDSDVEDALFQTLYQPGVQFYQNVLGVMGRIAKIDPWHRTRGTVEDEIEVMNIGAEIATDLRSLHKERPLLMDCAVAGKLTQPHISTTLARALTRAFRTYLSNFYACKVHLHRVAYKTLPLTDEVRDALTQIHKLAREIVADLDTSDSLPATLLWPLLMLGVEEVDESHRVWIRAQITRMENAACNALFTKRVLDEVQARQDAAKARMDIRAVMHDIFDSCFAII